MLERGRGLLNSPFRIRCHSRTYRARRDKNTRVVNKKLTLTLKIAEFEGVRNVDLYKNFGLDVND